jgi:hypothetical protein
MGTSTADWIMAAGTAGAALGAAFAARKASQSTEASVDLVRIERERLEEERRQRAVAELRAESRFTRMLTWQLVVINEGPAAATDVTVSVHKADDPTEPYTGLKRSADVTSTRDRLAPQEEMTVETVTHGSSPLRAGVTFVWSDSRGRHERTVSLAS